MERLVSKKKPLRKCRDKFRAGCSCSLQGTMSWMPDDTSNLQTKEFVPLALAPK